MRAVPSSPQYHNNAALAGIGKACNTKFDCDYTIDASPNGGYMGTIPKSTVGGDITQDDGEPFAVRWRCSDGNEAGVWKSHLIEVGHRADGTTIHLSCPFQPQSTSKSSTTPEPDADGWFSLPMQHVDHVTVTLTAPAAFIPGYAAVQSIQYSMSGAQTISGTSSGTQTILNVSAEGVTNISFHGVDADGNREPDQTIVIRIDNTPPTNAPVISPLPNAAGWNNKPVDISFVCSDSLSGIATNATDVAISSEGRGQSASGTCTDKATNSTTAVATINIDETPPTVSYSGNQSSYAVDDTVNISCAATDSLSGIAGYGDSCSSTPNAACKPIVGPAYSFAVGTTNNNAFQFAASDVADNCASTTTSFKVIVTYAALCNLVDRFSTNSGVSAALCNKLNQAQSAPSKDAKAGHFNSFKNQVNAQSGKAIPAEDATILNSLADICLQEC
jgi:hypothetical protein